MITDLCHLLCVILEAINIFSIRNLCNLTNHCFPFNTIGVPQIEVTFEIDADGILNVLAEDKATGKVANITITNDKGRLSQSEIEKMIREAEENAEDDRKVKESLAAKQAFTGYLYSLKQFIEDKDKLADKLAEDDRVKIKNSIEDGENWLSSNEESDPSKLQETHLVI